MEGAHLIFKAGLHGFAEGHSTDLCHSIIVRGAVPEPCGLNADPQRACRAVHGTSLMILMLSTLHCNLREQCEV